jgi:hypothetical protein
MKAQLSQARRIGIAVAVAALLATSTGCSLARTAAPDAVSESGGAVSVGSNPVAPPTASDAAQPAVAPQESKTLGSVPADRMIVSTSSMGLQVEDIDKSLAAVRALAAANEAEITELSVQSGEGGVGGPVPLGAGSAKSDSQSSSAMVTLRVPSQKLASVEAQAAKLGKVLNQSASESDVTQQHVDLTARLRNLQAEEVRLRSFFDKATKVSEMLLIENELSRVRGEIEAMQAQIAYLDRQTAMATLTLALSAPGALVQPTGGTWGFSAAVTSGFQAAAAVLRALITLTIALAPILLLVALVVLVWRSRRRRRLAARDAVDESASDAAPENESAAPAE